MGWVITFIYLILTVVMLGGAVYFMHLYRLARKGTLPLNPIAGIRTSAVTTSEDTWRKTHQRYAGIFLVGVIGFAISGVFLILALLSVVPEYLVGWAVLGCIVIVWVLSVAFGIVASRYARSLK